MKVAHLSLLFSSLLLTPLATAAPTKYPIAVMDSSALPTDLTPIEKRDVVASTPIVTPISQSQPETIPSALTNETVQSFEFMDSNDLEKRAGPAAAAGAAGAGKSVNVDFQIDVNGFVNQITNAIKSAQNRDGFVKQAMEVAFQAGKRQKNVMVFNMNLEYDYNLKNVHVYRPFNYDGIPFGIWIFDEGTFVNKGDGGWINWAFRGWFTRSGGKVVFRRG